MFSHLPRSLALRLGAVLGLGALFLGFFFLNFGWIEVRSEGAMSVTIDGELRAEGANTHREKLSLGEHQLLAVRPGYDSFTQVVNVNRLRTTVVEPTWHFTPVLEEIAGARKPWLIPRGNQTPQYFDDQTAVLWPRVAAAPEQHEVANLPGGLIEGRFSSEGRFALFAAVGETVLRDLDAGTDERIEPRPHDDIFAGGQLFELQAKADGLTLGRRALEPKLGDFVPMPVALPGWTAGSILDFRDERILLRRDAPDPRFFIIEGGEIAHEIDLPGDARGARFLADGEAIYETTEGIFLGTMDGAHEKLALDVDWARSAAMPDGRLLFFAGEKLQAWSPQSHETEILADLTGKDVSPSRIGFLDSGKSIAFTSDGRAWRVRLAE